MTYHSNLKLEADDGFSDELVDEIVMGLFSNRMYNEGSRPPGSEPMGFTPVAYTKLCWVDAFIHGIGRLLDEHPNPTEEDITTWAFGAPEEARELVKSIVRAVAQKVITRDKEAEA